jgi:hypothetical protein
MVLFGLGVCMLLCWWDEWMELLVTVLNEEQMSGRVKYDVCLDSIGSSIDLSVLLEISCL